MHNVEPGGGWRESAANDVIRAVRGRRRPSGDRVWPTPIDPALPVCKDIVTRHREKRTLELCTHDQGS